jgi:hypothetical protein
MPTHQVTTANTEPITSGELNRIVGWTASALVAVGALAFVAAQAPERVRLLVWFAVAFGLVAGSVLGRLVATWLIPFPRTVRIVAAFLIAGGEVATSVLAHRRQVPDLERILAQRQDSTNPLAAAEKQFLEQSNDDESPEAKAARQQLREEHEQSERLRREWLETRQRRLTWQGYLQHRVSTVGAWPSPWPESLWVAEIIVSSVAGAWLASRAARRPFCRICSTWLETTRSVILRDDAARRVVDLLGAATPEPLASDSRLHLHLMTCHCLQPATFVTCDFERAGRSRALPIASQPSSVTLAELESLMTSQPAADRSHCDAVGDKT